MKTVFILSYNNLGLNFWKNHLNLKESDRVYQFRNGQKCIQGLNCKPDMLIVDDYFAQDRLDDLCGTEVIEIINQIQPQISCFHISPENCGYDVNDSERGFVQSNFTQDMISKINHCLHDTKSVAA